jgi:hypothetical protein
MQKLNRKCFQSIINLIMPYMDDADIRKDILTTAWYDTPLEYKIKWTGSAQTFTSLAVREADKFGHIEKDVPALLALLEGLRPQVGYDVQERIDKIIQDCFAPPTPKDPPQLPSASNSADKKHLFISYSSSDRHSFVSRLAQDLTDESYQLWVDNLGPKYSGITAGKAWQQELADALHQTQTVVFVITPDSIRSVWCQAELARASEQNTPIIPILARPIGGDDYGIMAKIQVGSQTLSDIQYRDFTQGYDQGLAVLLTDIQKHIT